jgi:signal transduction histidine kinase
MFEDREGNLWVGSTSGLTRFRDDVFTMYGKSEGFPSDEPNTVYQDRAGRVWIGFVDGGVRLFAGDSLEEVPGAPRNRIFAFHETRSGELMICSGAGLTFLKDGKARTFVPPDDPFHRKYVYDALEGPDGSLWIAGPNGIGRLQGEQYKPIIPGGPLLDDAVVSLALAPDGGVWAASHRGLWYLKGDQARRYGSTEGLASEEIHSVYQDPDGTLWIGTFGGGLSAYKDGKFSNFGSRDGLLSDNVSHVIDDGQSLWLSTTRGICRVTKAQLSDFSARRVPALSPTNYGIADGLRSMQYSSTAGAGGGRHRDGSLWFVTSRGIAVYPNQAKTHPLMAPEIHLVEMSTEAQQLDWTKAPQIPAGGRLQIRYAAIHLTAPERVEYSYKLDGLDHDWVSAKTRRGVTYSSLGHGDYHFRVRADLPGAQSSEADYAFTVLPRFYDTAWFRALAAGALLGLVWVGYRVKARQVRARFAAVLEERARIAREVHDTLAQGFVGISTQLEVLEHTMPKNAEDARISLKLAQGMARHSLTEARRSMSDLRSAALEDQDLAAALRSSAEHWTAGSGVELKIDVQGETASVPEPVAHQLLRIAQEAVVNVLKHAHADEITLKLNREPKAIKLSIHDNGCGFEQVPDFSSDGHFGLMGMRERALQAGGEFTLKSQPGEGTELEVSVPL